MIPNAAPYPQKEVDYRANVLNRDAERFYNRHGAAVSEPALEAGGKTAGRQVMITRYCIRHELGACPKEENRAVSLKEPLFLTDGRRAYRLAFDCRKCLMTVHSERDTPEPGH
jgi:putative protease